MQKLYVPKEVQQLYQEFLEYSKKNTVPSKIHDKVIILAKLIFKQNFNPSNYPSLDQDQIKQLEVIEPEYKIKLFMSVANCLIGKEQIDFINQRQAYFKKNSFWSSWTLCYITYNDQVLTISKKKEKQEMLFIKMRISAGIKASGKKYVFTIQYEDAKYSIGFDSENIASQYRQKIKSLISNKIKKGKLPMIQQPQRTEGENSNFISEQDSDSDKEFLQQFDVENIENQANFKVILHTDNGRIMMHKDESNRFKSFILVECTDPGFALELYMKSEEWNPQINETKIINRTEQNCYVIYQSYKSTGYLTRPRDFVLLKIALRKKNRYLLLEKSITHHEYPPYKISVRANIKKKATAFIPHPTNKKLLLLITQIDVDFGGYNSVQNNKNLALKYFESYEKLSKYIVQKSFLNLTQRLFDFETKHHFDKIIYEAMKMNQITEQVPRQEQPKLSLVQELKLVLPKHDLTPITDKYIQLIRTDVNWYYNIHNVYDQRQRVDESKSIRHIKTNTQDSIFYNEWKFHEDGELQFINQKAIDAQKDIIKYILKQIGSNLLKGKSIMNMSLPVDIFDNKSLLQKIAGSFGYAPILLSKAAQSKDQVVQIKLATVFMATINNLQMKLQKPFNPILGQTFQGFVGGIPIYLEQISHHPPISSLYMQSDTFKFYGSMDVKVDMGLNTVTGYNLGFLHLVFKSTNLHLECFRPGIQISGVSFGGRKFRLINKIALISRERRLYSEASYGKDKKDLYVSKTKMKPNEIIGGVFKISQQSTKRLHEEIKKDYKFSGVSKKDVIQKLGEITGSWNGTMYIDGEAASKVYDPMPYQVAYQDFPLASDSNYRQDILFRRMGNYAQAQISKQKFENIQRNDRKLRGKKH